MTAFQETRRSRWQYKSQLLCAKPAIITKQAAIFISMTSSANTQERSSSPNNPGRRLGLRHRLTLREKLRKKGLISSFRTLLRFAADRAR